MLNPLLKKFILENDIENLKLLLNNFTAKTAQSTELYSPLGLAASLNHIVICKLLIYQNADFNYVDGNQTTALMIALEINHQEIAKYLIEKGAKVNNPVDLYLKALEKQRNYRMK